MGKVFSCCASRHSGNVRPIAVRKEASGQSDATARRTGMKPSESCRTLATKLNAKANVFLASSLRADYSDDDVTTSSETRPKNPSPPANAGSGTNAGEDNYQSLEGSYVELYDLHIASTIQSQEHSINMDNVSTFK